MSAQALDALTVLIAEDSAADLLLLYTIVRRQGPRVLTASDGQEAVALFAYNSRAAEIWGEQNQKKLAADRESVV